MGNDRNLGTNTSDGESKGPLLSCVNIEKLQSSDLEEGEIEDDDDEKENLDTNSRIPNDNGLLKTSIADFVIVSESSDEERPKKSTHLLKSVKKQQRRSKYMKREAESELENDDVKRLDIVEKIRAL